MMYGVVDTQTISIGESEASERTILAVKVQYLDEGIDHTKIFEFAAELTDEEIKVQIEEYGKGLKGNEQKIRKIELEGSII